MMKRILLLVLAVGCGDDSEYDVDCTQPLPATSDDGSPWPSYTEASAQLSDCAQLEGYYFRRRGTCSDGKRLLIRGTGFVGDTFYFDGETMIGWSPSSDVITCDPWRYGETRCDEVQLEEIRCRRSMDRSAPWNNSSTRWGMYCRWQYNAYLNHMERRTRTSAVTIRMSEQEIAMLRAVAEAKGLSVSDAFRQYVRREHEKLVKQGKA